MHSRMVRKRLCGGMEIQAGTLAVCSWGISGSRQGRPALDNTVRPSQIIASTSSRLRRWQTELNHSSPLQRRDPLHALQELGGYVKLNYFRHGSILQVTCPSTSYKTAPTSMSLPFPPALI